MAAFHEDRDRQVVPRWREYRATVSRRELSSLREDDSPKAINNLELNEKLREWKENPSFSFAADLLSSGVALGCHNDVTEAAKCVLSHPLVEHFPTARGLAEHILGLREHTCPEDLTTERVNKLTLNRRVHNLRLLLIDEPRNAMIWTDLSRLYETVALPAQAAHAMQIARALAPNNRFVLRSAARLYIHRDDPALAHDMLRASSALQKDPWLLSAEIAVAAAAQRKSRFVKRARAILENDEFPAFHLSELASAVAMLELEAGNTKRARTLLRDSLIDPSENSIAQAAWVARRYSVFSLGNEILSTGPPSYEARAWHYQQTGEWEKCTNEACRWLIDQPFSSRPAILGSYIASVALEDYELSARIAEQGLLANPSTFLLLNNCAFAYAQAGNLADATKTFAQIREPNLTPAEHVIWHATKGLIQYREGNVEAGRRGYLEALRDAERRGDTRRYGLALLFMALEELRLGTPEARQYSQMAIDGLRPPFEPGVEPVLERVRTTLSQLPLMGESG